MGLALRLYEQLDEATDDRARFRLIVDAIGQLEDGWPRPGEIARSADVREAELRLQLEIEGLRKEIREVELRLEAEIEGVRKEIKEVELQLKAEIEGVRKEIKEVELRLQREIIQSKNELLKWLVPLMLAQVAAIAALVKLL